MKKKKKPEVVKWEDLKVGDFIEDKFYRFFCFKRDSSGPSCLGQIKGKVKQQPPLDSSCTYIDHGENNFWEQTRMKPTKSFVKVCKQLLDLNFKKYHLDNLSYIEALAALKKYE